MVNGRRVQEPYSFPERNFQIWDYRVSHAQMVIRSPGENWDGPHLDLHFSDVGYMRIPTLLRGLSIVPATEGELTEAMLAMGEGRFDASWVWILKSAGSRHLVVAGSLLVAEANYPMMSTALVHPQAETQ